MEQKKLILKKIGKEKITATIDEDLVKILNEISKNSKSPLSYVINFLIRSGLNYELKKEKEEIVNINK